MSHPWVHMFASSSCTGIGSSSFFSAGELSCQSVSAITKLSMCRTSACFVECSFNHRLKRLSLIRIGRARLQICCTGSPADPYAQCSMSPTLKTRKPGSTCVMGLQARVWVNYLYVETLNLNRHCVRDFGNQGLGTLSNHVGANHCLRVSGLQRASDTTCMSRDGRGTDKAGLGIFCLKPPRLQMRPTNSKSTSETVRVDVEDSRC